MFISICQTLLLISTIEIFIIDKIKNTVPWTYVISDLNGEPIPGSFYEKRLQNTRREKFKIEKVIKKR